MRTFVAVVAAVVIVGSASLADAMGGGGGRRGGGGGGGGSTTSSSSSTNAFQVTNTPGGDVNLSTNTPEGGTPGYEGSPNSTSAVPEPGTLLLLASGTAGLVSWARRRK